MTGKGGPSCFQDIPDKGWVFIPKVSALGSSVWQEVSQRSVGRSAWTFTLSGLTYKLNSGSQYNKKLG